ncbi:MAG TPA: nucleotidyltransferase family protein [Candidatus Brocadiia bacterium]|nr:nucleotidyltransferase family protein [Candidatus Brocadiales bacterium]
MKTIILSAGKGERIRKVVGNIPKPMIKVKWKPVLEHNVEWVRNYGIRDIYINLHHLPNAIRSYFGDGSRWGVKITYSYEPELLGTAGAVRKIADEYWQLKVNSYPCKNLSDNAFLVIYGDNLFEYELGEIVNFHDRKKGIATIAVYEKDDVRQSGVVLLGRDNKVTRFVEKPKPEEVVSNLVNTGIYVLEPEVLGYIPSGKTLDFGKDVFPEMIQRGESILGIIVKGNLIAIDTPELLEKAL